MPHREEILSLFYEDILDIQFFVGLIVYCTKNKDVTQSTHIKSTLKKRAVPPDVFSKKVMVTL
jgi:hypothetical protein